MHASHTGATQHVDGGVSQQHGTQRTKNCIVHSKPDELMATSCRLSAPRTAAVQTSLWSCTVQRTHWGSLLSWSYERQRSAGLVLLLLIQSNRKWSDLILVIYSPSLKQERMDFLNPRPYMSRLFPTCFCPCCRPLWVNQQPAKQNSAWVWWELCNPHVIYCGIQKIKTHLE